MQDGDVVHEIKLNKSELRKKSLLIATPMQAGNCTGVYAASLAKLACGLQAWEIPFSYLYYENESLVPRARNEIAVEFLNSSHTHILLVDADIGFEAGNILVMMAYDKEFIAAPYPVKRLNWERVKSAVTNGSPVQDLAKIAASEFVVNYLDIDFDVNRTTRVSDVGTGCMLLSRTVFSRMANELTADLKYKPMVGKPAWEGFGWSFFDCGRDENGYYQPEDYTFCQRWRKLGGEIWLCPWMTLTHRGTMNFTGNMKFSFLPGSKFNAKKKGESKCLSVDRELISK